MTNALLTFSSFAGARLDIWRASASDSRFSGTAINVRAGFGRDRWGSVLLPERPVARPLSLSLDDVVGSPSFAASLSPSRALSPRPSSGAAGCFSQFMGTPVGCGSAVCRRCFAHVLLRPRLLLLSASLECVGISSATPPSSLVPPSPLANLHVSLLPRNLPEAS